MFNIPRGEELINYITSFSIDKNIEAGILNIIGSLKNPVIAYYDWSLGRYIERKLEGDYELASGIGNISLKEDKPFLHLHVVLGGRGGEAYAGHLIKGIVNVAETIIYVLSGPRLVRERVSGNLWLWRS